MLAVAETPRVSVVMPVYNAMPYLDIAVESILGQTYQSFEFVILDDASTDGSTQRLREWAKRDPRIRMLEEKVNLGRPLARSGWRRQPRPQLSPAWTLTMSLIRAASRINSTSSIAFRGLASSGASTTSSTQPAEKFAVRRPGG